MTENDEGKSGGLARSATPNGGLQTDVENLNREGVSRPSPSIPALEFTKKRAVSNSTQVKYLIRRLFDLYWRTASCNLTRFIISIVLEPSEEISR